MLLVNTAVARSLLMPFPPSALAPSKLLQVFLTFLLLENNTVETWDEVITKGCAAWGLSGFAFLAKDVELIDARTDSLWMALVLLEKEKGQTMVADIDSLSDLSTQLHKT